MYAFLLYNMHITYVLTPVFYVLSLVKYGTIFLYFLWESCIQDIFCDHLFLGCLNHENTDKAAFSKDSSDTVIKMQCIKANQS